MKNFLKSIFRNDSKKIRGSAVMDETEFTQAFIEEMKKNVDIEITKNKTLEISYAGSNGTSQIVSLENAFRSYAGGEDLKEIVERYVKTAVVSLGQKTFNLNSVLPVIRDCSHHEASSLMASKYIEGLVVLYVMDFEEGMRYIDKKEFEDFGIQELELRKISIENLRKVLPEKQIQNYGNSFMVLAGGNYESSILLLEEFWNDFAGKINGVPIVAIPARDVLLITGSENPEGIREIRETAQEIFEKGDNVITNKLLIKEKDSWMIFD